MLTCDEELDADLYQYRKDGRAISIWLGLKRGCICDDGVCVEYSVGVLRALVDALKNKKKPS